MSAQSAPSAVLLAANERLNQLRATHQTIRPASQLGSQPAGQDRQPSPYIASQGQPGPTALSETLPVHLGWGSATLTAVLRRQAQSVANGNVPATIAAFDRQQVAVNDSAVFNACCDSHLDHLATPQQTHAKTLARHNWARLYPDIGLGMLRRELAAPGRLWLMCHHLDPEGRGVLRVDILREQLTQKTSANYLCGKRQLRNLLRAGEGVFWTRDKHERLWLHSAGRVAAALGVERLTGRPVALPLSALLSGIGEFRAHLYAAFHSGRAKGEGAGMPIARDTLATLSGVGGSSQRAYEARLRLRSQANYAVGEVANPTKKEERAWKQGEALFTLKDYRGEQGKQGRSYLAWQLPNSYRGQHQRRPKGRQKRINRHLRDLVMKGMPGNGGGTEETRKPEKRYYANGRSASQSRGPHIAEERYWRREGENGRSAIWHPLQGG